jgi:hypothetical protein
VKLIETLKRIFRLFPAPIAPAMTVDREYNSIKEAMDDGYEVAGSGYVEFPDGSRVIRFPGVSAESFLAGIEADKS